MIHYVRSVSLLFYERFFFFFGNKGRKKQLYEKKKKVIIIISNFCLFIVVIRVIVVVNDSMTCIFITCLRWLLIFEVSYLQQVMSNFKRNFVYPVKQCCQILRDHVSPALATVDVIL